MKEKTVNKTESHAGILNRPVKVAVVILLFFICLAATGALTWYIAAGNQNGSYTAVYLENGDVYFGKLSYFPHLTLSDVYTVQLMSDPSSGEGVNFRVVPFVSAIWGPEKIRLNYDKILFLGKVGEDSQVMQVIRQNKNN